LPFVARTNIGIGDEGVRSDVAESVFEGVVLWVRRFCVRIIEPWLDFEVVVRRFVRAVKNFERLAEIVLDYFDRSLLRWLSVILPFC
jgi:hypothetical protein